MDLLEGCELSSNYKVVLLTITNLITIYDLTQNDILEPLQDSMIVFTKHLK